jgi:hypothetical protein
MRFAPSCLAASAWQVQQALSKEVGQNGVMGITGKIYKRTDKSTINREDKKLISRG